MDPVVIVAIAVVVAFFAGVVVHKYVVSEAQSIKQHVTEAEARIRGDFQGLLNKAGSKL